ncbi:MAG: MFS transporter [Alphaproteobacteria bacterium PA4]|nr:MAG: MFS transporter [Alphaproteobacteria bacterium PA4]
MSRAARLWTRIGQDFLPFADAATTELPLSRLLRLSLFQVSVGLAMVLLNATLNRVMIVELKISATLVGLLVALPLLFAPLRALIGHKSDTHRSILGWKRVPYLWFGTLLQFAGLAIMPFALLVMTGEGTSGPLPGEIFGAVAFLMVGAGVAMTQTAGLALANDLAPAAVRPRVVSLLYVMLLVGMLLSSLVLGRTLTDFTPTHLIQVIQGTAAVTMLLNLVALWKQEPRSRPSAQAAEDDGRFADRWADLMRQPSARRLLTAVGLGAAGFGMQDILLEPYGGQVLGLNVGQTTALTALSSMGTLLGLALAARALAAGRDPARLAGYGALAGIAAFAMVVFSAPLQSVPLFCAGVMLIGFGNGLFAVCTLTAAMALGEGLGSGLALGAWGSVQATAAGLGVLASGAIRDGIGAMATAGTLGPGLADPSTGYSIVWHIEIGLLFVSLVALGPLARRSLDVTGRARFGLAEFPT